MEVKIVVEKLKTFFEKSKEVQLAILFGSTSKGKSNKLSDLDLAVMVDPKIDRESYSYNYGYGYSAHLTSEIMRFLKTDKVDVLILNDSPPILKYEVLRHGQPIIINDQSAWSGFQIQTLREHADFNRIFALHKRKFMSQKENKENKESMSEAKDIIIRKLLDLERYAAQLRRLQRYSYEDIASDLEKLWSLEHGLQLCIQLVLDIGNQILAEIGENRIETYADVVEFLGERGIITPDFAMQIRGMAGFRNILVHQYTQVNVQEVYNLLQNQIDDFTTFIEQIKRYLSRSD